jgi:alkylated DNA repair protein (DNA oxidative demethylase)
MTGLGPLNWITDAAGYRYEATHPVTGRPWPPMPKTILQAWEVLAGYDRPPEACLINWYGAGAKMGLHQDRDEIDLTAPVLSVSVGDTAVFRIGPEGGGATRTIRLASGDVCALAGPARLARHGIDRVVEGSSSLLEGGGRLNLTLRRAGPASRQS